MSELLAILFLFFAVLVLMGIIVLVFMHVYQIIEEPNIQKRMRKLRKPVQPWVTVLLYSRNNDTFTGASLKALFRSYYHNFDIVVVNDYSNDSAGALRKAHKRSLKGKIVVLLQAGAIVSPSFLKRAVAMKGKRRHFTLRVSEQLYVHSLTEIVQSLNSLLWQRTYKVKVCDAKNITAMKKLIRLDFLSVLLFAAIVIFSLIIHEPIIVWYSWLIVTGYSLAVIWLKEEKVRTKMNLTFTATSAMFILPVAIVVINFSQRFSRNPRI
jgi:hypothetical protein